MSVGQGIDPDRCSLPSFRMKLGQIKMQEKQDEEVVPMLRTHFKWRLPADFRLPHLAHYPVRTQ
jgi:hypothetical protein